MSIKKIFAAMQTMGTDNIIGYGYALYFVENQSLLSFNRSGQRFVKPQRLYLEKNDNDQTDIRVYSVYKNSDKPKSQIPFYKYGWKTRIKLFLTKEEMLDSYTADLEKYKEAVREYKSKLDEKVQAIESESLKILDLD